MTTRLLAFAAILLARPVVAQDKSLAELLPAKTLFYVEAQQPGALAKEIGALLKGSYLADVPESLAPLRKRFPAAFGRGGSEAAYAGLAFAPEILAEAGRLKGAAFAITGVDMESGGPEYLVLVQPGKSNAPGFVVRMALTMSSYGSSRSDGKRRVHVSNAFERTDECDGVGIYRMVRRVTVEEDGKALSKEEKVRGAPALAQMPGLILLGSPELMKQTIRRARGKAEASLAGVEAFQLAAKDSEWRPGLFAFVNLPPIFELIDKVGGGREPLAVAAAKSLLNPKALRSLSAFASLEKGTFSVRERLDLDPKEASPLMELLPDGAIPPALLNYIAPDSLGFFAISNDKGGARLQKLADLADGLFKANGAPGPLPSEMLADLKRMSEIDIDAADLAGKIRGIAGFMPGIDKLMAGREPPFALAIEATDAEAAKALAKTLPKLFSLIERDKVDPTIKKTDGVDLSVLQSKRGYSLTYVTTGSTLILSPRAALVPDALAQAKTKGLRGDAALAKRLDALKGPIAVAGLRFAAAVMAEETGATITKVPARAGPAKEERRRDEEKSALMEGERQLLEVFKKEEPLLLSLTKTPERVTLEASYPGLHGFVPRLIDVYLEMAARASSPPPPAELKKNLKSIERK